jgi:hypothetical protein
VEFLSPSSGINGNCGHDRFWLAARISRLQ